METAGAGTAGRMVRAGKVTLGNIAFERPLVTLSQEVRGHPLADGIIGLGLLELMTLSTDVKGDRLWVKRNNRQPQPERFGMSGLWLEERGGTVRVADVSPLSPAADAGIAVGDELVGVPLNLAILKLAGKPGTRVSLRVRRGGTERDVALTLRPYI